MSTPTPEFMKEQIDAYSLERPVFERMAQILKRVFEEACRPSVPSALVQARAKEVSSFAEKCVRKAGKYPNPVRDLNDLCGVRVIVQTLRQVEAVSLFVEANFRVVEKEDKAHLLKEDRFGYRDLHYLVALRPDRPRGLSPEDRATIGDRVAELQVRTCVQHAWADTLHDRMYKTRLKLSAQIRRDGALLAALMENGDQNFDHLAGEVDGMLANYSAHASAEDVKKEIETLGVILRYEISPEKRAALALDMARLIVDSSGCYEEAVRVLEPHADTAGGLRYELQMELGYALCRRDPLNPRAAGFRKGQQFLKECARHFGSQDCAYVPDLRRQRGLHARALARLAWSRTRQKGGELKALEDYQRALDVEPGNPYLLAEVIGFERVCGRLDDLPASLLSTLHSARDVCRAHEATGMEMPRASFTAGRFNLLLESAGEAVGDYARGLAYCRSSSACLPGEKIMGEMDWILRYHHARSVPEKHRWVLELLGLAALSRGLDPGDDRPAATQPPPGLTSPLLVIGGGAASYPGGDRQGAIALLRGALSGFQGTVIAGGTRSGIPGCAGDVTEALGASRRYRLIGYVPKAFPEDAPRDNRYDHFVTVGESEFSAVQILRQWADILAAGIDPGAVTLIGLGGGPVSALEYRIALAMGATVGVVQGSGGAADQILMEPAWKSERKLCPLPRDLQTLRVFAVPTAPPVPAEALEKMAEAFHLRYLSKSKQDLGPAHKAWADLEATYKVANREQARFAAAILEANGFGVRPAVGKPVAFSGFRREELDRMAEMEHGRWNVERLLDGWRPGKARDDKARIHNNIVPWSDPVLDSVRDYDLESVRAFPEILALAGFEVYRKAEGGQEAGS